MNWPQQLWLAVEPADMQVLEDDVAARALSQSMTDFFADHGVLLRRLALGFGGGQGDGFDGQPGFVEERAIGVAVGQIHCRNAPGMRRDVLRRPQRRIGTQIHVPGDP